jgi:DNA-binding response OmpR family regulator
MSIILSDEGYEVRTITRGAQALSQIDPGVTDLVILDIGLPDIGGFEVYTELRFRHYSGPIIFLTGHRALGDKLEAFRLGADDYLTKPFEPLELVARVASVIRRYKLARQAPDASMIQVGDAQLGLGSLTYSSAIKERVILTPTETRLLEYLMREQGRVVTRETLIEHVWGLDALDDTNRVDVYIRRIRQKIEREPTNPKYLHTKRGTGYVFRPEADAEEPA